MECLFVICLCWSWDGLKEFSNYANHAEITGLFNILISKLEKKVPKLYFTE
jgi:hypothetical protein